MVRVLCRTGAAVRVVVGLSAASAGIPRRGRSDCGALRGSVREDDILRRSYQLIRDWRIETRISAQQKVDLPIFSCGKGGKGGLLSEKAQA